MPNSSVYAFGPFRLIPSEQKLLCNDRPIPLTPRTFDLLVVLVENSGHMLEKEELLKLVWKSTFVEEGSLTRSISTLRKVFTDEDASFQYIETIPKRGYRFIVEVRTLNANGLQAAKGRTDASSAPTIGSSEVPEAAPPRDARLERSVRTRWRGKYRRAIWVAAAVLVTLAALAVRHIPRSVDHFRTVEYLRLTDNGKAHNAALSPDGKYVAYVLFGDTEDLQMSLWIRQLATDTELQLVPAARVFYKGIQFSTDGNFIYYVTDDLLGHASLFQVSTLGGSPRKLMDNVISAVGLSPDGSKLTFERQNHSLQQLELIITDADATHDRVLTTRRMPALLRSPSWSPNGKLIVCISQASDTSGPRFTVVGFDTATGQERRILATDWTMISQLAWLSDGTGLIMTGMPHGSKVSQLWMLRMPGG